ncbi:MAG: hypothetical protein JWR38_5316 [Mucilaginibacter sp.]|nr:hypothetical protein [Mucilaginibacter sp.]
MSDAVIRLSRDEGRDNQLSYGITLFKNEIGAQVRFAVV